jgi:predicted DNA-binding protein (UPF0251 family)
MQREMPVHGEPKKIKHVPSELLQMSDDELDAVRLCIQLSRFTQDYIGKQLSIDKGHFSRIMSGSAGFPTAKRVQLMKLCGNRAPVQFEAAEVGCVLVETAEFEQMRAELDELRQMVSGAAPTRIAA